MLCIPKYCLKAIVAWCYFSACDNY